MQINARATYSISFGGTYPDLFSSEDPSVASQLSEVKWKLYLPKAYHPILLQQHREKMHKAMKDVGDARAVSDTTTCIFIAKSNKFRNNFLTTQIHRSLSLLSVIL